MSLKNYVRAKCVRDIVIVNVMSLDNVNVCCLYSDR